MRFPPLIARPRSGNPASDPDEILQRANALFREEPAKDLRGDIEKKTEGLHGYDVKGMERAVAILAWGRSGSLLLSSYFDGQEDVLMLPELCGWKLYEFFERYETLSWRDKLLAYPAYDPHYTRFFEGAFAISTTQYYAAVQAMLAFYAGWPEEFLESRKTFFLFVHIAYNLALGRKPASSHPLIVWARHSLDNGHLAEDFLDAKFVHTVRDPISSCDAYFHYFFDALPERHIMLPYTVLHFLIKQDRPQSGMERRTRTVRLEDMHGDTAQTMRDLADWLGLRYQEILLDSTFNGIAYVVKRDGVAWSGQRVEQMQRQSRHISRKDRALLFALFYENFRNWNYPCPKVFRYPIVRCSVAGWLGLWPMKMEIAGARAIFQRRILTHLRRGNILGAIKSLLGIGFLRVKIIGLLVSNVFRRSARPPAVLQLRYEKHAQGREGGVEGLETTYERS